MQKEQAKLITLKSDLEKLKEVVQNVQKGNQTVEELQKSENEKQILSGQMQECSLRIVDVQKENQVLAEKLAKKEEELKQRFLEQQLREAALAERVKEAEEAVRIAREEETTALRIAREERAKSEEQRRVQSEQDRQRNVAQRLREILGEQKKGEVSIAREERAKSEAKQNELLEQVRLAQQEQQQSRAKSQQSQRYLEQSQAEAKKLFGILQQIKKETESKKEVDHVVGTPGGAGALVHVSQPRNSTETVEAIRSLVRGVLNQPTDGEKQHGLPSKPAQSQSSPSPNTTRRMLALRDLGTRSASGVRDLKKDKKREEFFERLDRITELEKKQEQNLPLSESEQKLALELALEQGQKHAKSEETDRGQQQRNNAFWGSPSPARGNVQNLNSKLDPQTPSPQAKEPGTKPIVPSEPSPSPKPQKRQERNPDFF